MGRTKTMTETTSRHQGVKNTKTMGRTMTMREPKQITKP